MIIEQSSRSFYGKTITELFDEALESSQMCSTFHLIKKTKRLFKLWRGTSQLEPKHSLLKHACYWHSTV